MVFPLVNRRGKLENEPLWAGSFCAGLPCKNRSFYLARQLYHGVITLSRYFVLFIP
jgi:hypothetical protein